MYNACEWILEIINAILDLYQYGLGKECCTTIALVEYIHEWLIVVEDLDTRVKILLFDFRKTFDRVDHLIILTKLVNTGVSRFPL